MIDFTDLATAMRAVMDPATTGADLAQIVQAQPSLWPLVANHPNAYPDLLVWLRNNGDAATQQVVAARQAAQSPLPAAVAFGQPGLPVQPPRKQPVGQWIAAIVAVIVVVAVVLAVIHPWQPKDDNVGPAPIVPSASAPVDTPAGPTGAQVVPPDGNSTDLSQAAWITVPGAAPTKAGALRVDIHFDYQCPWCKMVEDSYAQPLTGLAATGDIVLNLHARTFLDGPLPGENSTRAAVAAACVDYADNTKYGAYSNTVFINQPSTEGVGYTDQQLTVDFPASVGLSGDALDKFKTCYAGRQTQDWVNSVEQNNVNPVSNKSTPPAFLYGTDSKIYQDPNHAVYYDDATKGDQVGVTGTPTIFVNGKPLGLGQLFNQPDATSYPAPAIGTDAASLLTLLQQIANS